MAPKNKEKDNTQDTQEESQEELIESPEDRVAIVLPPFRIIRQDPNNIVIQKLKKRKLSEEHYWDTEGYYSNISGAFKALFYKDISSQEVSSVKELLDVVKSSETRILKAIKDISL